jgi:death on curing protein
MTRTPVWVLRNVVEAIHDAQLAQHGGATGVRDAGLLECAFPRPRNFFAYADTNVFDLAAAYAFGLARNHPFVDGNKSTAFLTAYVFLHLNGKMLIADEVDATTAMLALASGRVTEADFANWLRRNSQPS